MRTIRAGEKIPNMKLDNPSNIEENKFNRVSQNQMEARF